MAGPTDISTILSQTGRIEKINQNPFVQSEVARQILTEEEAKARLRKNKEVAESKKAQEISVRDKTKGDRRREIRRKKRPKHRQPLKRRNPQGEKHIIDVVV